MPIESPAEARQRLDFAEARLVELRAAVEEYFAGRPYHACIAPHATLPGYTEYRVRIADAVPRKVQSLAWEVVRALRSALEQAPEAGAGADLLDALDELCRVPRRRFLVPEVKAKTELAMAEHVHAHPASLHAPEWNPKRREVTILYKDPEVLFKGRIAVEFYLALGGSPELRGHSAVAVLHSRLQQVREIVAPAGGDQPSGGRDARTALL